MFHGHCLCGGVAFEVHGPLRDVIVCHCVECRRWHGNVAASTAAKLEQLTFTEERGMRWIDSPDSDNNARRGFCGECGSAMFWHAPDRDYVAIAVGTIDPPTGLRIMRHIYTHRAGDWYDPPAA